MATKSGWAGVGAAVFFGVLAVIILWIALFVTGLLLDEDGSLYPIVRLGIAAVAIGIGVAVGYASRASLPFSGTTGSSPLWGFVICMILIFLMVLCFFYLPLYFVVSSSLTYELLGYVGTTAIVVIGALAGIQLFNALA